MINTLKLKKKLKKPGNTKTWTLFVSGKLLLLRDRRAGRGLPAWYACKYCLHSLGHLRVDWGRTFRQKTSLREDHNQRLTLLSSASILYHMERERRSCKAFVESVLFTIVCTSFVRDILRSRPRMSGSMFPGESWLPRCL